MMGGVATSLRTFDAVYPLLFEFVRDGGLNKRLLYLPRESIGTVVCRVRPSIWTRVHRTFWAIPFMRHRSINWPRAVENLWMNFVVIRLVFRLFHGPDGTSFFDVSYLWAPSGSTW